MLLKSDAGDGLKNLALLDSSIAFSLTPSTMVDNVRTSSTAFDSVRSPSIMVDSVSLNATEIHQC